MSLLEGPLNVLGQRTTGESVRTQNGELTCDFPDVSTELCFSPLKTKMVPYNGAACSTRAVNANAS